MMNAGVQPGTLLGGWTMEKKLGSGAYGEVWLGRHTARPQEAAAVKITTRALDARALHYLQGEILNLRQLCHPHIVRLKEVFAAGTGQVAIAMEYASGGNLLTLVQRKGRLQEAMAQWYFQQLCLAVDFCHKRQVAHRDIKLENLLLEPRPNNKPLLKLSDFGLSKVYEQSQPLLSKVGTLAYMAPEVLISEGYDGNLADVWSCGVVLFTMLAGMYPFGAPESGENVQVIVQRIKTGSWQMPADVELSPNCWDLLRGILVADPVKRICMRDLMSHPWFKQNLPQGVLEYNDRLVANPPVTQHQQTEQQIRDVLSHISLQMLTMSYGNGGGGGAARAAAAQ